MSEKKRDILFRRLNRERERLTDRPRDRKDSRTVKNSLNSNPACDQDLQLSKEERCQARSNGSHGLASK